MIKVKKANLSINFLECFTKGRHGNRKTNQFTFLVNDTFDIIRVYEFKKTFFIIFKARDERSFKLPIGVPTKYKTPFSGS